MPTAWLSPKEFFSEEEIKEYSSNKNECNCKCPLMPALLFCLWVHYATLAIVIFYFK